MLEDLVTSKINIDNANIDQISFIINLMRGYSKNDLLDKETRKRKINSLQLQKKIKEEV